MTTVASAGLKVLIFLIFAGTFSAIFSFPGTLLIFFPVLVYAWTTGFEIITVPAVLVLAGITVAAEVGDFLLGLKGVKQFDLSVRGIAAAFAGGLIGAVLMTPLFFGLGMLSGLFLGGMVGVAIMDMNEQQKLKPSRRMGYRDLLARSGRVLLKGFLIITMACITMSAIYS
ncbi:MAG: DUF456 domain-containing protein [Deltaproteobacteria bacterium]|nr:DUF456 domain-containing protein [Deltaproteobacteria bacterium]